MTRLLPRRTAAAIRSSMASVFDPAIVAAASAIVEDVRTGGEPALRAYAERLDGLRPGSPLVMGRDEMKDALKAVTGEDRTRLERVADRILRFAEGQRGCLQPFETAIPGGWAGHTIAPVARAGCYAPGGRHPLPSSVLMTAVTARAAGVREVIVASPHPSPMMLAAAALADADGYVVAGGAQAIAALAFGAGPVPSCDVVVGPGNAWVTAAKKLVSGFVGIDMLAGPSELVALADASADAAVVAADLLAQAEHDPVAVPVLVSIGHVLADAVEVELERQLSTLPTADVARAALANGGVVVVDDLASAVEACDALAPEHLALFVNDSESVAQRVRHFGALFIGTESAEVLGDYGAGPNHVLPTGGASRFTGGLSVLTFLRVRTWMTILDARAAHGLVADAVWLARAEGLEAHARSAERRQPA